jgi:hypothetical protein
MGTVILCITVDNGDKHSITLTHMNYMPKLPVNLLSTRVLSKQYINENGFDKEGMGFCSVYENLVLFWNHS